MGWLQRWWRITWEHNPTFPLSAACLLAGLHLLDRGGGFSAQDAAQASVGLALLGSYQALLAGVALLVLWPRRIRYETTSILVVLGVVRQASPLLLVGLAAEGHPGAAALLGAALLAGDGLGLEAVVRRVGLDLRGLERGYDRALFAVAALGLPVLAERLACWTGDWLSQAEARTVLLGTWWGVGGLVAPLALGLGPLRLEAGPLRTRLPALVGRGLWALGLPLHAMNALWVGGEVPGAVAFFPLTLALLGVVSSGARALGGRAPRGAVYLPAALAGAVLLLPPGVGGGALVLRPLTLFLAFLPLAAGALWIIDPARRATGLRALAVVVALAPLGELRSGEALALYAACAGVAVLTAGALRREERLFLSGAVLATLAGVPLLLDWDPLGAGTWLQLAAVCLVAIVALRLPGAPLAGGATCSAATLLLAGGLREEPGLERLGVALALSLSLHLLGLRAARPRLARGAGLPLLGALARRLVGALDPGTTLVTLAFAAIPLGTALALRRARREEEAARALAASAAVVAPELEEVAA